MKVVIIVFRKNRKRKQEKKSKKENAVGVHHGQLTPSQCGHVHGDVSGTPLYHHRVLCQRLPLRCAQKSSHQPALCAAAGLDQAPQHGSGCSQGIQPPPSPTSSHCPCFCILTAMSYLRYLSIAVDAAGTHNHLTSLYPVPFPLLLSCPPQIFEHALQCCQSMQSLCECLKHHQQPATMLYNSSAYGNSLEADNTGSGSAQTPHPHSQCSQHSTNRHHSSTVSACSAVRLTSGGISKADKTHMQLRCAGCAASTFPQTNHPAPGSEIPQHAGGAVLESEDHRLQFESYGADLQCWLLCELTVGQQPKMACT